MTQQRMSKHLNVFKDSFFFIHSVPCPDVLYSSRGPNSTLALTHTAVVHGVRLRDLSHGTIARGDARVYLNSNSS